MTTVGIIDYGLGNLRSVSAAVLRLGHEPVVSSDPVILDGAEKLILPGVGAFADGMRSLRERGLIEALNDMVIKEEKAILGVCLGAQLIAEESEEFGQNTGLGWIEGSVRRLRPSDPELRIPHIGWDGLKQTKPCFLFDDIPDSALFYYVHSYCLELRDDTFAVGYCDYGIRFVAALKKANILATQFHPEKSQRHGLTLLRNFLAKA